MTHLRAGRSSPRLRLDATPLARHRAELLRLGGADVAISYMEVRRARAREGGGERSLARARRAPSRDEARHARIVAAHLARRADGGHPSQPLAETRARESARDRRARRSRLFAGSRGRSTSFSSRDARRRARQRRDDCRPPSLACPSARVATMRSAARQQRRRARRARARPLTQVSNDTTVAGARAPRRLCSIGSRRRPFCAHRCFNWSTLNHRSPARAPSQLRREPVARDAAARLQRDARRGGAAVVAMTMCTVRSARLHNDDE